jgi:uncharacterized membrane protein
MNIYLLFKLIHILAVIIFLGNITTGLFWMKQADKTGNPSVISFTMKGIIASDKWFTVPGVIVITAGGIAAAVHAGLPLLRTGWICWSLLLFSVSGIIFGLRLAPLQRKFLRLTQVQDEKSFNNTLYSTYLKQWKAWGLLAMLTPFAALVMMVLKIPVRSGF